MLIAPETQYVLKLVKDFLDETLEKNSDSELRSRCYHHMMTLLEKFLYPGSLSTGVESIFLSVIKTFFAQRG